MVRRDTPMEVSVKGALAGMAGTIVLTAALRTAARVVGGRQEATEPAGPASPQEPAAPPARLVSKVAAGVFERDLPPQTQRLLGQGIHWGYGALWGMIYGIVQASIRLPVLTHGSILGLIVWLVGPLGLARALKLAPPEVNEQRRLPLRSLFFHELYGWSVALVFALLWREG